MLKIAPTSRPDARAVFALLDGLDRRYAGGMSWLDRRLDDIARRRAMLWEVRCGRDLAALAIVAEKGRASRKLCTFKVAQPYRRHGLGATLLSALRGQWIRDDIETAYVTVDRADRATQQFFISHGFPPLVEGATRYAADRYDDLFVWKHDAAR